MTWVARGRTLMQSSCAKCPAFFGSVPAKSSPPARPAKVQSPQAALGVSRCFKQQESTKALQILWICSQKTTKMHVSTPKPLQTQLRSFEASPVYQQKSTNSMNINGRSFATGACCAMARGIRELTGTKSEVPLGFLVPQRSSNV